MRNTSETEHLYLRLLVICIQVVGISASTTSYSVLFKGENNSTEVNSTRMSLEAFNFLNSRMDSKLQCNFLNYSLADDFSSGQSLLNVTLLCSHDLPSLTLRSVSVDLYERVQRGLTVDLIGVQMTSELPLYVDGRIFDPSELIAEHLIIIILTVTFTLVLLLVLSILLGLKLKKIKDSKKAKNSVSPDSSTTSTSSPVNRSKTQQATDESAETSKIYQSSSKHISEWQPTDFYADIPSSAFEEYRTSMEIYEFSSSEVKKRFNYEVDKNASLQKLRKEMRSKIEKEFGTPLFVFYSVTDLNDLEIIIPQTEYLHLVRSVYPTPHIIIRALQGEDKEKHGWMLCSCGNIGRHRCSCTKQLFCTRYCQQTTQHSVRCNTIKP